MSQDIFEKTSFVLVRPEFLGNIGSIARVMKNFGFSDLRMVDPPKNYKDAEARMMAVDAIDILKSATLYTSLAEAIADIEVTVSTSSGRRRRREVENLADKVDELVSLTASNRLAIVFGNERNGLLDDEIALCNRRIRIESSAQFAALNLAQAVGIIAYSLATAAEAHTIQPQEAKHPPVLPTTEDRKGLSEQLDRLLGSVEFSRTYNKRLILQELEDALNRMTPSKRETAILRGVLFRLNHKLELISSKEDSNSTSG